MYRQGILVIFHEEGIYQFRWPQQNNITITINWPSNNTRNCFVQCWCFATYLKLLSLLSEVYFVATPSTQKMTDNATDQLSDCIRWWISAARKALFFQTRSCADTLCNTEFATGLTLGETPKNVAANSECPNGSFHSSQLTAWCVHSCVRSVFFFFSIAKVWDGNPTYRDKMCWGHWDYTQFQFLAAHGLWGPTFMQYHHRESFEASWWYSTVCWVFIFEQDEQLKHEPTIFLKACWCQW